MEHHTLRTVKDIMILVNQNHFRERLTTFAQSGMPQLDGLRYSLFGQRILHCFGDSHLHLFAHLQQQHIMRHIILRCNGVAGATAMGMVNPNSKTNALQIFRQRIRPIPHSSPLLFMLGEVDCGFVIWYRASKYQLSVESQLEFSLKNYQAFVLELKSKSYQNITLTSAPLPTIRDGEVWGEIANARREVKSSLRERTELTLCYNQKLRSFCSKNNLGFLDFEKDILDAESHLIKDEFLHPNPQDHHLNPDAMMPLLVRELNSLGFK